MGPVSRKTRLALTAVLSWAGSVAAQPAGVEIYPFGTIDLRLNTDRGLGREVNLQRRGDSPFSRVQANLFVDIGVTDDLVIFNQLTLDPSSRATAASFLRTWGQWRVISTHQMDASVQLGMLPTPFGHFSERAYTDKNPLLGQPLPYHFFTSLRSNQLPADNADLLAQRGSGSGEFGGYGGGGDTDARNGLPLIYDSCWDYGGAVIGSLWRLEYLVALTQGTLSDPRPNAVDNNDGLQVAARVGFVPFTGAMVRASWARGPYLDSAVANALPAGRDVEDYTQQIAGLAVEYQIRHSIVIAEAIHNRWQSPYISETDGSRQDLAVDGYYVELRQKLGPGLFAASRWSALRFGRIGDGGGATQTWDRNVDRLEVTLGYWMNENVLIKTGVQLNDLHAGELYDEGDHIIGTHLTVKI